MINELDSIVEEGQSSCSNVNSMIGGAYSSMSFEGNHELTLQNGQTVFIRSSEGNPNKVTMLTE